jgi:ribosomal protein S18 acetylase RimI-like enzyme
MLYILAVSISICTAEAQINSSVSAHSFVRTRGLCYLRSRRYRNLRWKLQILRNDSTEQTANERGQIHLRAVAPEDESFLLELYASTRAEELAAWGWSAAQQELFLKMQLKARDQSYLIYYSGMDDRIILLNDEQAGRLIVNRTDGEIRVVDIALLPAYRGQGIGTSLIGDLFGEADEAGKVVRLQVERTNPQARSLYQRLGFEVTSENQTHFQMERKSRDEG